MAARFGIPTSTVATFAQGLCIVRLQIDETIDRRRIDVAILATALAPVRTAFGVSSEWQEQPPAEQ